jgi:CubicO group peptidase (beta-lactamase class C family)
LRRRRRIYTPVMSSDRLPDGAWGAAAVGSGRLRDLDDLPQLLQSEGVAGLSVALTDPSGIRAEAYGAASPDGTPLTPDSMLQAGSVSKAVTAYAAHRLAAEGRLDLDADVNDALTSWKCRGSVSGSLLSASAIC